MTIETKLAGNGETLTVDDSGRLVDQAGRYGYTTHFTGAYVCYTCGLMCECSEIYGCGHELLECPNHGGAYDCTPFCRLCEGNQGYCPECDI